MISSKLVLRFIIPLFAIILVLILSGCEITNPTKDLKVIVNTIERETMVSVTFQDIVSDAVVSSELSVEITGKDADKITDEVNNKKTNFTVKNGFLSFAVANGTNITEQNPVIFILKVTSSSYLNVEYPVKITSTGTQNFYINMVKNQDLSQAGVEQAAVEDAGTADNTGSVAENINVTTDKGTNVNIPRGTVLKDENGSPLTGELSVSTTIFYPEASQLIAAPIQEKDTVSYNACMSFSIVVSDKSGKTASSPEGNLFIPASADLIDPETNQPYQPGDKLSVGYIDDSGKLVFTGEIEYVSTSRPAFPKVKSSSGWVAKLREICPNGRHGEAWQRTYIRYTDISLGSSFANWDFTKFNLEFVVDYLRTQGQNGNYVQIQVIKRNGIFPRNGFKCSIYSHAYFRSPGNDNIRFSDEYPLKYEETVIELKVPDGLLAYDVMVKGKCPNDRTKEIIPGGTVVTIYDETGTDLIRTITLSSSGTAGFYLKPKGKYKIRSTYNGTDYEADIEVAANGVPFISGPDIEVLRIDATKQPIILQYYILTTEACD